jgi:hypothetical protein
MTMNRYEIFYAPKDRLRMTIDGERSVVSVKPVWVAPLSHPNRFLSLMNGKSEEVVLVDDLEELEPSSREAVEEELRRRYLTSTVTRVLSAKSEFGATYWHVDTERGPRDFVTQSLQENAQWMSPVQLLLIDVDGNRFEVKNIQELDSSSQSLLAQIL